jgi:hypothetical protein
MLALGVIAVAVDLPHNEFLAGDIIRAEQVNANFRALSNAVTELESAPQPGIAAAYALMDTFAAVETDATDYVTVTIQVPAPGVVEVRGEADLEIVHASGGGDSYALMTVATTPETIEVDNAGVFFIESSRAPGRYFANVSETLIDEVASAGTYTYYLNARQTGGNATSTYRIVRTKLVATYFPTTIGPLPASP